ncbi:MAG: RNA polymerase sigma factor [Verrucomicrobiota bacterium]
MQTILDSAPDNHDARFLKLIGDNQPRLLKICRVYAWGRADQDDLYQEMVFQIWRALPNLREQAHADTWLYRIALNTAISFVRKDKSRRNRLVSGIDQSMHDVPDTGPHRDPDAGGRFSQLAEAIAQLNDTEKAVITLFLEDLSYEQMAAVLGVTESNIGVMLHRAKKKLSTLMKEAPCTTTP